MTLTRSLRWTIVPLAMMSLAGATAGCAATAQGASTDPGTTTGTTSSPAVGSAPGAESTDGASNPAPQQSGAKADRSRCRSQQLRVTAKPGDGSAGHPGLLLIFTNTGSAACTMYGYPGATFMTGENGQQVNEPATRATATPATVSLAPAASAQATLRWTNPDLYDEATCKPVQAAGVRVYPPDETTALFAASQQRLCSAPQLGRPEIYPVQSRTIG